MIELRPAQGSRLKAKGLFVLLALQLALALPWLTTVPRLYNDEAWEASIGRCIADQGRIRNGIIEGWGGMDVHFVQPQMVQPFVCAALFKLAGCSIWTARFASVLASLVGVAAIYTAMSRLFGSPTAWVITLLTQLNPWFFEISRRARPEIFYIACGFTALAWLLKARSTRAMALAGVAMGLTILAHPTGAVLLIALLAGLLLFDRDRSNSMRPAIIVPAALATLLPYVAYVLWATADPRVSFRAQLTGHRESPLDFGHPLSVFASELARWQHFFQWPIGAPLALVFLAAWLTAWRRARFDRACAAAILLFALAMPFTTVNATSRYLVALVPLFAALIVRLAQDLAGRLNSHREPALGLRRHWLRFSAAAAVTIYLATSLGGIALMIQRLHAADPTHVFDRIAAVTGPSARIFGRMFLWFGEPRYRYGPFCIDEHWQVQTDAVRRHAFDYAVRSAWDFNSSAGISAPPAAMPPFRADDDIDPLCRQFGTRIAEFRDPAFGPFELYRLDGSTPLPPPISH